MLIISSPEQRADDKAKLLEEWINRLSGLIESVDTWAQELGWATRRTEKKMEDSQIGHYRAPALIMQKGTVRIILEPIARSAPGAEGVVDLYLMPAYDDIATLFFYADGWKLHYPFPNSPVAAEAEVEEVQPLPLSKETLKAVLQELMKDAA
jgi:hypothetical protein